MKTVVKTYTKNEMTIEKHSDKVRPYQLMTGVHRLGQFETLKQAKAFASGIIKDKKAGA